MLETLLNSNEKSVGLWRQSAGKTYESKNPQRLHARAIELDRSNSKIQSGLHGDMQTPQKCWGATELVVGLAFAKTKKYRTLQMRYYFW